MLPWQAVVAFVIFLLVVSELRAYFTPTTTDHLYVDTTRGERIRINTNITFRMGGPLTLSP